MTKSTLQTHHHYPTSTPPHYGFPMRGVAEKRKAPSFEGASFIFGAGGKERLRVTDNTLRKEYIKGTTSSPCRRRRRFHVHTGDSSCKSLMEDTDHAVL